MLSALTIPLLTGAAKIGMQYFNKPKKQSTEYLDRYINNLKGQNASNTTSHLAMQSAMKNIGAVSQENQRQTEIDSYNSGTAGSGFDAARKLDNFQATGSAIADASSQAAQMQASENAQRSQRIDEAIMRKDQILEQNEQQKEQWKQGLTNSVISAGVDVAGAGISSYLQGKEALKSGFDAAQVAGTLPEGVGNIDQYKEALNGMSPEAYNQRLGITQQRNQESNFADAIGDLSKIKYADIVSGTYGNNAKDLIKLKMKYELGKTKETDADIEQKKQRLFNQDYTNLLNTENLNMDQVYGFIEKNPDININQSQKLINQVRRVENANKERENAPKEEARQQQLFESYNEKLTDHGYNATNLNNDIQSGNYNQNQIAKLRKKVEDNADGNRNLRTLLSTFQKDLETYITDNIPIENTITRADIYDFPKISQKIEKMVDKMTIPDPKKTLLIYGFATDTIDKMGEAEKQYKAKKEYLEDILGKIDSAYDTMGIAGNTNITNELKNYGTK